MMMGKKSGKGGVVPCSQPEDKRAQGFSESGIPQKVNVALNEGTATEKSVGSKHGAIDARTNGGG